MSESCSARHTSLRLRSASARRRSRSSSSLVCVLTISWLSGERVAGGAGYVHALHALLHVLEAARRSVGPSRSRSRSASASASAGHGHSATGPGVRHGPAPGHLPLGRPATHGNTFHRLERTLVRVHLVGGELEHAHLGVRPGVRWLAGDAAQDVAVPHHHQVLLRALTQVLADPPGAVPQRRIVSSCSVSPVFARRTKRTVEVSLARPVGREQREVEARELGVRLEHSAGRAGVARQVVAFCAVSSGTSICCTHPAAGGDTLRCRGHRGARWLGRSKASCFAACGAAAR